MNPVTLSADTTVDSGAGATTFVSTVDGDHTLTVMGGVVDFGANVGSITPLAGLDVTGLTNLFGNVTTNNGPITFNSAVLINANLTLNSGTAATTFGGTVDSGDCACDLTANAGAFSFGGAFGGQSVGRGIRHLDQRRDAAVDYREFAERDRGLRAGTVTNGALDITGDLALNAANDITRRTSRGSDHDLVEFG